MANSETEKANQVARNSKTSVVELESRVSPIEGVLRSTLDKAAGFESGLQTYRAKYSEAKSTLSEKDCVIGEKESQISSLS